MTDLILGTAQFGAAYGITNAAGRIDDAQMHRILGNAAGAGITQFDTAADYGDAQERLGALAPEGSQFITKFHLPDDGSAPTRANLFDDSRVTLGVATLSGVMFHRVSDLADDRVAEAVGLLREARADGTVDRAGVSVYDDVDLDLALSAFPDLSILQVPGNVLDRRLIDLPRIKQLHESGVAIHVRSAFLQGLLLGATPSAHFAPLSAELTRLSERAATSGHTLAGLALGFLREHPVVDAVVVGVTTPDELAELVGGWSEPAIGDVGPAPQLPVEVLDPRLWPKAS